MKKINTLTFIGIALCTFIAAPANASTSLKAERWTLKNGAQVVFYEAPEVPMLDVAVAFKAGSAYDKTHWGLSALTTQLINAGNASLNADIIAERLADTGAQFSAESTRDMAVCMLRTLTEPESLNAAINTFSMIINHPDFPDVAFTRQKNQQLITIAQTQESPDAVADLLFYKALYPHHPYAHNVLGDKTHVSAITREDVLQFYKQHYTGKNAVMVLVGALHSREAHQFAETILGALPAGEAVAPVPEATDAKHAKKINHVFPTTQTVIRIGQLGITHHDPAYFPLIVGNYILGGGTLVSDLAIALREKRGLTYGVSSQFSPMPGIGPFSVGFSTKNDQATEAVNLTYSLINNFLKNGPTSQTLAAAKQYLTGSFALSLASNRNMAEVLLRIAFYGLPENYLAHYKSAINAVSLNEIKTAFQSHLHNERWIEVRVGQQ